MWAGSSRTDVLLGHAALLWRSPSLCCLHSRHLHSLHCCLKSFKSSSLSPRLLLSLSLPPSLSAQTLPLPCCLEMKRSENGDNGGGGGGGGVSYQRRMKEERDQRGGEGRPAGERGSLFGILWIFMAIVQCQCPLITPSLQAQGKTLLDALSCKCGRKRVV